MRLVAPRAATRTQRHWTDRHFALGLDLGGLFNGGVRRGLADLLRRQVRNSSPRSRDGLRAVQVSVPVLCNDSLRVGLVGSRSEAVFGALAAETTDPLGHASILIADNPTMLIDQQPADQRLDIPCIALTDLPPMFSVPAIDPHATNPINWKAAPNPALTPADSVRGSLAPAAQRRAHHVVDWTSAERDPAVRAGMLARAAAAGVVVCVSKAGPELRACLGQSLCALMTDAERIVSADDHDREAISIAMRRAALRDHSARARLAQALDAASSDASLLPRVSVLVPTRRPDRLAQTVAAVASQTYPCIELVIGLHGDGFDEAAVSELLNVGFPAQAVFVAADRSLGEVLNAALAAAQGQLIAKFDDDDLYGPDHLWDLVLAAEYSQAAMVGKVAEYVYLADTDRTIRRFSGFGERYIDPDRSSVAGGAVLARRESIDAIGGWQAIGVGEDKALTSDIGSSGGSVYRTHGAGYLLMRHGIGHTWEADDSYFLEQAHESREGCDLSFAGLD